MYAKISRYRDSRGWAVRGACQHNHDPELFFPIASGGPAAGQVARAKAVCGGCPVRGECLEFALETGQDFGVWGGTTADERRRMRRSRMRHRRAQARQAEAGQSRRAAS
jgi:WhiB family transcriptional regulator, redox-sensing transcriptional regulator